MQRSYLKVCLSSFRIILTLPPKFVSVLDLCSHKGEAFPYSDGKRSTTSTLGVLAHLKTITILCSRCDRRGVLSVHRLLRKHGPTAHVTVAWNGLNAHFPPRRANLPAMRSFL